MSMEEQMNPLIMSAMGILTHAGDARMLAKKALQAVQQFDFVSAKEQLCLAKQEITEAHAAQTEIIQNEARGIKYEYSMLFNHAQDTLMTINSEIELTTTLIDTFEVFAKQMNVQEAVS